MRAVDRPAPARAGGGGGGAGGGPPPPREDHLAVLGPVSRVVGGVEPCLDAGGARVLPDERGRASLAQGEQETHGDHRLASARLAGEHVQARRKLQLEIGDHPEAADVELSQHGRDASADR